MIAVHRNRRGQHLALEGMAHMTKEILEAVPAGVDHVLLQAEVHASNVASQGLLTKLHWRPTGAPTSDLYEEWRLTFGV
ncbi:hypothetical protein AB2L27_19015 [Kineococcus sp. LSe6-4]|uniref:GNAT family N-acetyltransferase n=1 Tax=Kineococcus halophytocola TaxID=3234027 RepID=A0ABV4H8T7_9ACTN